MAPINVLIVEDEQLFRQVVRDQLASHPEIEVVGEASTGEEAIELADKLAPEVVPADIELEGTPNGIQAGQTIKKKAPTTGIVLLSSHRDKQFATTPMAEKGAGWSYLLKKNVRDTETLARAIIGASWGIVVIDPELLEDLRPRVDTPLARLTVDQLKILELMAKGHSDAAIAKMLTLNHP